MSQFILQGNLYYNDRDYVRANEQYTAGIAEDATNATLYYLRARAWICQGQETEAIADLNKAIAINPDYADAYNVRGKLFYSQENDESAMADFDRVLTIKHFHVDAHINRGLLYLRQGNFSRALDNFDLAVKRSFNRKAESINHRGKFYQKMGNHQSAIADFTRSITLKPLSADIWQARAESYEASGDHEHAVKDYNEAIRLQLTQNHSHDAIAQTYLKRGQLKLALRGYTTALADFTTAKLLYHEDGRAACFMGQVYSTQGQHDEAIDCYTEAIQFKPFISDYYRYRAQSYVAQDMLALALVDLDKTIVVNALDANGFFDRALLHDKLNQAELAFTDACQAITLNPKLADNLSVARLRQLEERRPEHYQTIKSYLSLRNRLSVCYDGEIPADYLERSNPSRLMSEPVILQCGDNVDRSTLSTLKNANPACPCCGKDLMAINISEPTPNIYLRNKIRQFVEAKELLAQAARLQPILPPVVVPNLQVLGLFPTPLRRSKRRHEEVLSESKEKASIAKYSNGSQTGD